MDARVLAAAAGAAVLAALSAALAPVAYASRVDLIGLLKQGPATIGPGRRGWRGALLVGQIAFVTVLLVSTTLVAGSFVAVTRADLGFERTNLVAVRVSAGSQGTLADLVEAVRGVRGVDSVAVMTGSSPPLIGTGFGGGWAAARLESADGGTDGQQVQADMYRVSPEYFDVMRLPILRGRSFTPQDEGVVVLDERAARTLFGERDAIGSEVRTVGSDRRLRVIGLAGNVESRGPEGARTPQAYLPLPSRVGSPSLVIRTSRPTVAVAPAIEAAVGRSMPAGAAVRAYSAEEAFRIITAGRRFNAAVMSAFGLLALLIGAAGVYGVIASLAAQRTREIGVRLALGATRGRITATMLGDALRYLAGGLSIGLVLAWPASRIFEALLFGFRASDPAVYGATAVVVLTTGLLAALAPALRTSRVDPLSVLRQG